MPKTNVHSFTRLFIHSFVHQSSDPPIHSLIHPFIHVSIFIHLLLLHGALYCGSVGRYPKFAPKASAAPTKRKFFYKDERNQVHFSKTVAHNYLTLKTE